MFRYEDLRPPNINLKNDSAKYKKGLSFLFLFYRLFEETGGIIFFLSFFFFRKRLLKNSFLIFYRPLFKCEVLKIKNRSKQNCVCTHFRLLGFLI